MFIMTIWRIKSLHTPSNMLFLLLSATDLIVGLVCQPLFMATLLKPHNSKWPFLFMAYRLAFTLTSLNSLLFVTLITLNRFIAVFWPMKYRKYMVKKRIIFIAVTIVLPLSIITPIEITHYYHEVAFCLLYFLIHIFTLVFILAAHCVLYLAIKFRRKAALFKRTEAEAGQRLLHHAEQGPTKTIMIITLAFFVCHMPYLVHRMQHILHELTGAKEYHSLAVWGNLFTLVHSALNPMIYFVRRRDIRLATWRLFRKKIITNEHACRLTSD